MTMDITTVGVCGAGGTMGAGIAIVAARAGYATVCFDISVEALERGRSQTEGFFEKSVELGKMTAAARATALDRMMPTTKLDRLGACDLIVEAVFEDLGAKQELFARLDAVCPAHAIFASNTSTLSITEIAAGCGREDKVVGMHFCLPAQLMKLIEMSAGLNTSEEAMAAAWAWTKAAGQKPVSTEDRPGFILNALLVPFNNDAIRAVEAGLATPADIDAAIKVGLGYRMGPLELVDLIGLDTQIRLCEALYSTTLDPRVASPPLLRRMVAAGRLGRKSGRGFYAYDGSAMYGG